MVKDNAAIDSCTLFYDSECPICAQEMQQLSNIKKSSLILQPIHSADISAEQKHALYQQLHITTHSGQTLKGFDANCYAWQQTMGLNRYKVLAFVLSKPPVLWFGRLGYKLWLLHYHRQRKKRI